MLKKTLFKIYFFFFQAEDGIRDRNVTGVLTCALPIFQDWGLLGELALLHIDVQQALGVVFALLDVWLVKGVYAHDRACHGDSHLPTEELGPQVLRSEERRVGKECRARRAWDYGKKDSE